MVKYDLNTKSRRNSMSLMEANLRNHKSKSRSGCINFSKLMSIFEILFFTFDMLTDGNSISLSSGVKFAVYFENASNALVDLETKV